MSILVVGSVAYDSVTTSAGKRSDALGGSATYFSIASSYFSRTSIVAVVGKDFRREHLMILKSHSIDTSNLQHLPGLTFRWTGIYDSNNFNSRETIDTQLNVFADFAPELQKNLRDSPFLFLANIDPDLQMEVLSQMNSRPRMVALDTMNFWIDSKRDSLINVIKSVDVLFVDETEARSIAQNSNLIHAAESILALGLSAVVVKRGDYGVLIFMQESIFAAPAFPVKNVIDPTGAGDSFAGGFMGYIASTGDLSNEGLRRATVVGSVMGSFAVQDFSIEGLSCLSQQDVNDRLETITHMSQFVPFKDQSPLPWIRKV